MLVEQLGATALAKSVILNEGIFGTKSSPPQEFSKAYKTISTPSSKVMLNLVIFSSVIGSVPFFRCSKKKGTTEPLEPMTLPYRTTENLISLLPFMLLAATKSLSEQSFVAP